MSDLEWLAKSLKEWNHMYSHCCVIRSAGVSGQFFSYSWSNTGLANQLGATVFTKAQWAEERKRLGLDKPEWNGEGLPPVGVTAYCTLTEENHLIVAHDIISSEKMALTCDNDGYWGADEHHWKPIQTEEEKAIDEMVVIAKGKCWTKDVCNALYKAGYRKA